MAAQIDQGDREPVGEMVGQRHQTQRGTQAAVHRDQDRALTTHQVRDLRAVS
nr:hypothetical protein [Mycobacteroides abscessus]